jgi:hypothetical protein
VELQRQQQQQQREQQRIDRETRERQQQEIANKERDRREKEVQETRRQLKLEARMKEEHDVEMAVRASQEQASEDTCRRIRQCPCRAEYCTNTINISAQGAPEYFCSKGCAELGSEDSVVGTRARDELDAFEEENNRSGSGSVIGSGIGGGSSGSGGGGGAGAASGIGDADHAQHKRAGRCGLNGCQKQSIEAAGKAADKGSTQGSSIAARRAGDVGFDWNYCCKEHAHKARARGSLPPSTPHVLETLVHESGNWTASLLAANHPQVMMHVLMLY